MIRSIAAASCVLILTSTANAEVLWTGDFETGDASQWDSFLNEKTGDRQNIVIVTDPVQAGTSAAQITIHPDDLWPNGHNRVELHQNFETTDEGETTYVSWYFQLPENARQHNDIAYWESDQSYQQTMAFYVDPDGSGTKLGFRTNSPSSKEHWSSPLSVAEWHQLAMQVDWSTDAAIGKVSVWFDGEKVVDGVAAKTKADANPLFIQMGYHRNATAPDVETIFIDSAIEATTLAEVVAAPKAPGNGGQPGSGGQASSGGQNPGAPPAGGTGGDSNVAPPTQPGVEPPKTPPAEGTPPGSSPTAAPTEQAGSSNDGSSSSCSVMGHSPAGSIPFGELGLLGLVLAWFRSRRAGDHSE